MTREDHVHEQLTAYVSGELDALSAAAVREHLAMCEPCRKELASVEATWRLLERAPEEHPGDMLRTRFYDALKAYEAAIHGARNPQAVRSPGLFDWLIHSRPAVRFAFPLALVVLGSVIGYGLRGSSVDGAQVAQLRDEIRSVNRLLTVSLLQQQSASGRLQGVSWSYRLDKPDPDIINALLQTLRSDPNVNVRLAALDALSRNIGQPDVRQELLRALPKQSSPMVQLAIVDLMIQMREKQSTDAMEKLLQKSDVDTTVKKRIELGIRQLNS